jgi:hypothetical protein
MGMWGSGIALVPTIGASLGFALFGFEAQRDRDAIPLLLAGLW